MAKTITDLEREFDKFKSTCNNLSLELKGSGLSPGKANNLRILKMYIEADPPDLLPTIIKGYHDFSNTLNKDLDIVKNLIWELHHEEKSEIRISHYLIKHSNTEKEMAEELKITHLILAIRKHHKDLLNIIIRLERLVKYLKERSDELSTLGNLPSDETSIIESFAREVESIGDDGYKILKKIYYYHDDARQHLKNLATDKVSFNHKDDK